MEDGTLSMLGDIQILVSDKLQVVSYKWLSRNFSVSSNDAKRLLQKFIQEYGSGLEVIYTLSGWLRNNPEIYHVKLVSGLKLAEAKQDFEDNFSVQVYSVQACIPEDPAALWNTEFIQAEELFNQPSNIQNCLRDNRFCGVSNAFVSRRIEGKSVACSPPQPKSSNFGATFKSNAFPQVSSVLQAREGLATEASPKDLLPVSDKSEERKLRKNTSEEVQPGKSHGAKERSQLDLANKKKPQNEKGSSSGGSLANLWIRASAKSKFDIPAKEITNGASGPAVSAEAQIHASEAVDSLSSDDEGHNLNHRRDSNGENNRKRRVVFDFSDEEDDDANVVVLASQDPPKCKFTADSEKNLLLEEKDLKLEEQKGENLVVKQEKAPLCTSSKSPEKDLEGSSKTKTCGISLLKKPPRHLSGGLNDKSEKGKATDAVSTSPKRRKVLRTRLDERGREVTEVVWEGDAEDGCNTEKKAVTDGAVKQEPTNSVKPSSANKVLLPTAAPSNVGSKAGIKKTGKGMKDVKQGNILSFFKKI